MVHQAILNILAPVNSGVAVGLAVVDVVCGKARVLSHFVPDRMVQNRRKSRLALLATDLIGNHELDESFI